MIEHAIKAKVKAKLQPSSYVREIDYQYQQDTCLFYTTTKALDQKNSTKNPPDKNSKK